MQEARPLELRNPRFAPRKDRERTARKRSAGFKIDRKAKNKWLAVVEAETAEFRERMARKHDLRAMLALQPQEERHTIGPEWDPVDSPWAADKFTPEQYAAFNELRFARADEELEIAKLVEGKLVYPRGSVAKSQWHAQRAKGQRERFTKISECSTTEMRQACSGGCDKPGPTVLLSCDSHRLCYRCRMKRRRKFMAKFRKGQRRTVELLWKKKLTTTVVTPTRQGRQVLLNGGKWGERFFTLTLPHSGDVEADVRELAKAWKKFWRTLCEHVRKDLLRFHGRRRVRDLMRVLLYCKVLEVTPGQDFLGHAHLHVYMVTPMIDHAMLAHLWGRSLSASYRAELPTQTVDEAVESMKARPGFAKLRDDIQEAIENRMRSWFVTCRGRYGRPLKEIYKPVVDVRRTEPDMAAELCKYLIKDADVDTATGEIKLMEPVQFARIYCAIEGRRAITATIGFLRSEPRPAPHCEQCGCTFRMRIHDCKQTEDRGPPSGQMELAL